MLNIEQILLFIATFIFVSANIDLGNLFNYANQPVPAYITKNNISQENSITDAGATLGRVLFYDKNLSTNNSLSCSSCHQQSFAFSDTSIVSQGVNGFTERHSMRLVNIGYGEDANFRWDKTAESLTDQMIFPIKKFEEMGFSGSNGAPDIKDLIVKLSKTTYYPLLFNAAFGDEIISEQRIAKALAQFVSSIQSFDSKYDIGRAQVSDDSQPFPNFTIAENAGKALFIDSFVYITDTVRIQIGKNEEKHEASKRISGGLNCASCHRPPEFDIDPKSLNNGLIRSNLALGAESELNIMRSPTLRDLFNPDGLMNGGLFHIGQSTSFTGITAHYYFNPIDTNNTNLDPRFMPGGKPLWLNMTQQNQNQLNAFLRTLTGNDIYTNEKWSNPFDDQGNINLIQEEVISSKDHFIEKNKLQIYPNPSSNQFTIHSDYTLKKILILNSSGQVVQIENLATTIESIDISNIPIGLYFLKIYSADNDIPEIIKMMKE